MQSPSATADELAGPSKDKGAKPRQAPSPGEGPPPAEPTKSIETFEDAPLAPEYTGLPTPAPTLSPEYVRGYQTALQEAFTNPPSPVQMAEQTVSTSNHKFDGSGDYSFWKRGCWVKAEGADEQAKTTWVVKRVEGTPLGVLLAEFTDAQLEQANGNPFTTRRGVFQRLDPVYAKGAQNQQDAVRRLGRLRQGNKPFQEFLQEFNEIASQTGQSQPQLVGALCNAVSGSRVDMIPVAQRETTVREAAAIFGSVIERSTQGRGQSGRGRGGFRGRGNHQSTQGRQAQTRDMSNMECYGCGNKGHMARDCPDRRGQQRNQPNRGRKANSRPKEVEEEDEDFQLHSGNE